MTKMHKKLFLVKCKGMTSVTGSGIAHGIAYVVATDPNEAYMKLRSHLDLKDLGFSHERELQSVELIADCYDYNDTGKMLFL